MLRFLPDAPETTPEVLVEVSAIPTTRGYRNPYSPITAGFAALAAAAQGGTLVLRLDGTYRTIAGTATHLYETSGTSWSDVSRGALYALGSAKWRYAQFGDITLACNKVTVLQQSSTGAFADVADTPKASCIETAAGFVMLADVDGTATTYRTRDSVGTPVAVGNEPDRWVCSGINNALGSYNADASTQANSGRLVATPGAIRGLKRINNDIAAYKDKSLYLARYVGGAETWNFQLLADDIGCATQEAVVAGDAAHFFLGDADFFQFDGQSRPVPIGNGMKEWFFKRLNRPYASTIEGLHDAPNTTVYWFYPSGKSTTPNSCVAYNYVAKTWGAFDIAIRNALNAVIGNITYGTFGNFFVKYKDAKGVGYGSPFWRSATPVASIIGSDNILYTLTSTTGASYLVTGMIGNEGAVSTCDQVGMTLRKRPTTAEMTPWTQRLLGGTKTLKPVSTMNAYTGRFDLIQADSYHQFRFDMTGEMEVEAILPRFPGTSVT